ncbi:SDR family NAD(P)-dependent oxidoreductase [Aerococcus sp. UMB7834]|uniref:SDR family NAD(P)-dependent oxidoreductase n=1 Tax=Aerococcus sp. UMB7834 TaxID=3046342 RepID=UPI0025516901|nr:SDR family NAD(P)-dependent oxidoreductase [Aerococcus sp. UMB7834]MDK6805374.1 SDR family NAD(P)-dependent oxidoreductase [Aerococcus sp. UMB7834]
MPTYTLITGASSGIGEAYARLAASQGENLILVARREEKLAALKEELEDKYPSIKVDYLVQDLSQIDELETFYQKTKAYHIKCWINNAGFSNSKDFLSLTSEEVLELMKVDMLAPTLLSQYYLRDYQANEGACLVNVSSVAGHELMESSPFYSPMKFYISAFSENIGRYLHNQEAAVQVKILAPAAVNTAFINVASQDESLTADDVWKRYNEADEIAAFLDQLIKSDKVLAKVNLDSREFELLDPQLPNRWAKD